MGEKIPEVTAPSGAENSDALENGWKPARESLEAWRERRRAVWRAERDRTLVTGRY
jgi:hypothetical protein